MFSIRYRYLLIVLLAVYSYLNIRLTAGDKLFTVPVSHYWLFAALLFVVFGVWELNRICDRYTENISNQFSFTVHPLLILFIASICNVGLTSIAGLYITSQLSEDSPQFNRENLTLLAVFGFRVNLFLNCLNAIVFFMNKLKKTQLEAEQFKKISIEAQFEALRNQINPHFLFNCFNVLSTLVYRDADTSAKFIGQLSTVYRYLLYNQEKKIVTLGEEMQFIDAYLFLLKIRFGDNILVSNQISPEQMQCYVAPAVLQMLIENAIKHNVISRKRPLHIELSLEDNYVIVANTLQEKEVKEPSSQVGLQNIQRRYEFLSNYKVTIEKNREEFRVKIPLLQIERA